MDEVLMTVSTRSLAALVLMAGLVGGCTGGEQVRTSVVPTTSCDALVGPEPWLILFTESYPGAGCVSVAVFQDLQIWNKGFDTTIVEWLGSPRGLESDEHFETGPIGDVLEPGVYAVESRPYQAPDLVVVAPDDSFSAQTVLTATGFGAIEVGMTLAQASEAAGVEVAVDEDLMPGPDCWLAVIVDDPYSPLFTVEGKGDSESVITGMTIFYPSEASVNESGASVPVSCTV